MSRICNEMKELREISAPFFAFFVKYKNTIVYAGRIV